MAKAGRVPRVSVVMTTFNAMRHLEQALDSIRDQTFRDFEVVIVDDGSTDGTQEFLGSYAAQDHRFRPLLIGRCGRVPSLNRGVAAARGEYIALQDADDMSLTDRLAREVAFLDTHPDVGIVGAAVVLRVDGEGRALPPVERPTDERKIRWLLGRRGSFFNSSLMYRKSVWEELGGYDESFVCYEDYDFVVRALAHHRFCFLDGALAVKRRHPGQAFDQIHWTNRGYRMRSRILVRYFQGVRRDPRALLRAFGFLFMGRAQLQTWRFVKGEYRHDRALHAALGKGATRPATR